MTDCCYGPKGHDEREPHLPAAAPALDEEREQNEALWSLLSTKCHCEPGFTERDRHASDCHYDFIRWFLDEDQVAAARARLRSKEPTE